MNAGAEIFSPAERAALRTLVREEDDAWARTPQAEQEERIARFHQMQRFLVGLFAPYGGRGAAGVDRPGFAELRAIKAGGKPRRHFLPISRLLDREDKHAVKLAYRWAHDCAAEGYAIYCGVLPRDREAGSRDAISRACWAWVDFDFKLGGESAGFGRLEGIADKGQPDMVVLSGNGMHLYWRLTKILDLTDPAQRRTFEAALRRFQQLIQPGSDPVQDTARVLRVPGFYNFKRPEGEPPRAVILARLRAADGAHCHWN